MRVNIISKIDNGKGLERSYKLLRALLEQWGHSVVGWNIQNVDAPPEADLNMFLETVAYQFLASAPRNWLVINPDWFHPADIYLFREFEHVLCKTQNAFESVSRFTDRAAYLGFMSDDHYRPDIPREKSFFHFPGGATTRNTDAVIAAWERHRLPYPLTILSTQFRGPSTNTNIRFLTRVSEDELIELQNRSAFHLLPSGCEGWGHALHEAIGVGAILITTDAPPMNEIGGAPLLVPPNRTSRLKLLDVHSVSPDSIADMVTHCWDRYEDLRKLAAEGRQAFLEERRSFIARFKELLDGSGQPQFGTKSDVDIFRPDQPTNPPAARFLGVPSD